MNTLTHALSALATLRHARLDPGFSLYLRGKLILTQRLCANERNIAKLAHELKVTPRHTRRLLLAYGLTAQEPIS